MPLWTLVNRDHTRQVCEKCKQLHECVVVVVVVHTHVCVCVCGGGDSKVLVISLLSCGLSQNNLGYSKDQIS